MNGALRERGIPGYAYGQASTFRFVLGGEEIPEARAYGPNEIDLALLQRGNASEVQRLVNLAMVTRGVHFFGNGGIVSSVHREAEVAATIDAWGATLDELRAEGLL
jgi:glutamate-1-semialdehyde aminotransferase